MALAFAPIHIWPLAIIALCMLFLIWRESTVAQAVRRGYLFGLGLFGVGISWVYVTMHVFGYMVAPLAAFATLLFVLFLSTYLGLLGYVQARWFKSAPAPVYFLLLLPASWVLMEWLKGWLFTGFPCLETGYAFVDTYLANYASWLGIYGISLVVLITAGCMAYAFEDLKSRFTLALGLVSAIWIVAWSLGFIEWGSDFGKPTKVALVQINVPIKHKWQPAYRGKIIQGYLDYSAQAQETELLIWPEGALPMMLDKADLQLEDYYQYLASRNIDLLFGVVEPEASGQSEIYYNSVALRGAHKGLYRKQHLVPFGEYPPLEPIFSWLLNAMHIPMNNFSRGEFGQANLNAANQKLGVSICYENVFASEMRQRLPEATMLLNVSENGWYGRSFAASQLVQMARVRALEAARPMLRVDNAGPSVVIDHRGKIVATTRAFEKTVLSASVQGRQGITPYILFGNWPVIGLTLLVTGVFCFQVNRRRSRNKTA